MRPHCPAVRRSGETVRAIYIIIYSVSVCVCVCYDIHMYVLILCARTHDYICITLSFFLKPAYNCL